MFRAVLMLIGGWVLMSMSGCDARPEGDSADARTSPSSPWPGGKEWQVSEDPFIEIGEVEGEPEYTFTKIIGAQRLSDGTFVIGDGLYKQLRIYSDSGRFIRAVGRNGSGPGEFADLTSFDVSPDETSLYTFDFRERRVTKFDINGTYKESWIIFSPGNGIVWHFVALWAPDTLVYREWVTPFESDYPAGTQLRDTFTYFLIPTDKLREHNRDLPPSAIHRVATLPGPARYANHVGRVWAVHEIPFGPEPRAAISAGRLYYTPSESLAVQVYTKDGAVETTMHKHVSAQAVTSADISAVMNLKIGTARDELGRRFEPAGLRHFYTQLFREMPFPTHRPITDDIIVDKVGHIWVRQYRTDPAGEEAFNWWVFSNLGLLLGEVRTPEQFRPTEIGDDYILGIATDDLGVEILRVFRLIKPN